MLVELGNGTLATASLLLRYGRGQHSKCDRDAGPHRLGQRHFHQPSPRRSLRRPAPGMYAFRAFLGGFTPLQGLRTIGTNHPSLASRHMIKHLRDDDRWHDGELQRTAPSAMVMRSKSPSLTGQSATAFATIRTGSRYAIGRVQPCEGWRLRLPPGLGRCGPVLRLDRRRPTRRTVCRIRQGR